jgi:secreted trypsin-like serine protease
LLVAPATASAITPPIVKVVGGSFAAPGQFPWMAALVSASERRAARGVFCGGAVVAPRVIVTAAHCLEDVPSARGVDVVVGRTRLSGSGGQRVRASRLLLHPGYDTNKVVNDLALVQLSQPVATAPLATGAPELAAVGTRATTAGWGRIAEDGPTSDPLRFARLPVRTTAACRRVHGAIREATQLCAGTAAAGVDSCQGDSGGPLFVGGGDAARLIGIVSYGIGCGRKDKPGVYTRVSGYADWLAQNVEALNAGAVPPPPPPPGEPRVRIGSITCGVRLCSVRLRVTGRQPAGGIVLNAVRARTSKRKAVDRAVFAKRDAAGRWSGRIDLPVGRVQLYAFPLNAAQDDLDGDGDVETVSVTAG